MKNKMEGGLGVGVEEEMEVGVGEAEIEGVGEVEKRVGEEVGVGGEKEGVGIEEVIERVSMLGTDPMSRHLARLAIYAIYRRKITGFLHLVGLVACTDFEFKEFCDLLTPEFIMKLYKALSSK